MIEISGESRKQQLKEIWLKCYEDPADYVDFFFRCGFSKCTCISEVTGGRAVGVLYLFSCRILPSRRHGYYWYAGGVLPEFRHKGIYRGIVSAAMELAEREKRVSLCFPGPGLAGFYRDAGLTDEYVSDVLCFRADPHAPQPAVGRQPLTMSGYESLSAEAEKTRAEGSVVWEPDVLEYVLAENAFCGGFCDEIVFRGDRYFLFGQKKASDLCVTDTSIPLPVFRQIGNTLMRLYGVTRLFVSCPAGSGENGGKRVLNSFGNGGFADPGKRFTMTMLE